MTRYFVGFRHDRPLGPLCPACDGVRVVTGCQVRSDRPLSREAQDRTGYFRVVEVRCNGTPAYPVEPCPSCGVAHA